MSSIHFFYFVTVFSPYLIFINFNSISIVMLHPNHENMVNKDSNFSLVVGGYIFCILRNLGDLQPCHDFRIDQRFEF